MRQPTRSALPGRRFSLALFGCACAALPAQHGLAQGTPASAPVSSSGINVIGTAGTGGASGSVRFIDTGADGGAKTPAPSFTLLDYTTGSFGLAFPVTSVNNVSLSVTEANFGGSLAGGFTVYLTENTQPVATANGGNPLTYMTAAAPSGLGTQLGDGTTLFPLSTFTSAASTKPSGTDVFTLTLSTAAQNYFLSQLNGPSANDLRLVIASSDANGYATFNGNTSAVAVANQPKLSFNAVLNQPSLNWTPGGSANTNGGAGAWQPAGTAGDVNWNGGPWNSTTAQFGGTGGAVTVAAAGVQAQSLQFNSTGYTLSGGKITLTGGTPPVQVTNATDTATVNTPIAGTAGLNKTGLGTLTLGGVNTYTGTTTVSAGTLQISADSALGAAGNAVALAGGTLQSSLASGTLSLARALSGSGSLSIASGSTVAFSGAVATTALTLPGGGTLSLTNVDATTGSSGSLGSLTFQTANANVLTANQNIPNGQGVLTVGGLTANQTSGTATVTANLQAAGTVNVSVPNAGATLSLPGGLTGSAVFAKTGLGTLILGGDNSTLTGTANFRQGGAGTVPTAGGTIMIAAGNPNPNGALGTGQYQANGGTLNNATGTAITLPNSISSGAQDNQANTPGGLVFAGTGAITVTGNVSLFRGGNTAYQHTFTANTPTTFTGLFTASAAGTSTGVTIAGTSSFTLGGTAGANTFTEPVTVASGATLILAKDGALGANGGVTINAGATLTINTGASTNGVVNAVNDNALLVINGTAGSFGKVVLTLGGVGIKETVGGFYLQTGDGKLAAGFQAAGNYGPTGSPAGTIIDDNLFSGMGVINNLGVVTAVPEPSTWAAVLGGAGLLTLVSRRPRRA